MATAAHTLVRHGRLLCFGDSLTEGYTNFGTKFHPYALRLQALVDQFATAHQCTSLEVVASGVSGEVAIGSMARRLRAELISGKCACTYEAIVVLGGTNDMGGGAQPAEIVEAIERLYTVATRARIPKVFVMSIPETQYEKKPRYPTVTQERETSNRGIRGLAEEREDAYFIDLAAAIPQPEAGLSAEEQAAREVHWHSDGLHMTVAGYDRMAEVVFQGIRPVLLDPLLAKTGGGTSATPPGDAAAPAASEP